MYTKEQQADNRKTWVEALRSGNYKQTKGYLHDDVGYCCLGVACDISGLGGWEQKEDNDWYYYMDKADTLPEEVIDWLGLNTSIGRLVFHVYPDLAKANDRGTTFEQIANIIEREYVLLKDEVPLDKIIILKKNEERLAQSTS